MSREVLLYFRGKLVDGLGGEDLRCAKLASFAQDDIHDLRHLTAAHHQHATPAQIGEQRKVAHRSALEPVQAAFALQAEEARRLGIAGLGQ